MGNFHIDLFLSGREVLIFPGAKTLFDSGVGRDGDLYRLKFFVDFGV